MIMEVATSTETIECPECGVFQTAVVHHTWPWCERVHVCISCDYTIMESEWNIVRFPLPPKFPK